MVVFGLKKVARRTIQSGSLSSSRAAVLQDEVVCFETVRSCRLGVSGRSGRAVPVVCEAIRTGHRPYRLAGTTDAGGVVAPPKDGAGGRAATLRERLWSRADEVGAGRPGAALVVAASPARAAGADRLGRRLWRTSGAAPRVVSPGAARSASPARRRSLWRSATALRNGSGDTSIEPDAEAQIERHAEQGQTKMKGRGQVRSAQVEQPQQRQADERIA